MEVSTTIKYLRISPRKVNHIIKEVVGKPVNEALILLQMLPHKPAQLIYKALKSAKYNAVNNFNLEEAKLIVSEGYSGQAVIMKRFRAASRGRGTRIQKKLSHISIKIKDN